MDRAREAYEYCEALVRDADKDRFLASLFAPADKRPHLFALYAFNVEIARIREAVREPLPGELRLQWWRDALAGERREEAGAHPVAAALLDTVAACALPLEPPLDLIEARGFDLYGDPMPTFEALRGYARKTSSALIELAAHILTGRRADAVAAAADTGGIALALARLLQALPAHAARGQLYLPLDVLDRHGADPADVLAGRVTPAIAAALAELRGHARTALAQFDARKAAIPPLAAPAFLPVALASPLLAKLDAQKNPFVPVELPQWRRQWALWRAARGG